MNISMFEVNFGECIIYQENYEKVLVDCGAKYGTKGKYAYNQIKSELDDKTKLIITHFDEDHFNGILEIPDSYSFKEINLPLYIYDRKNRSFRNTGEVFRDTILAYALLALMGRPQHLNAINSLFVKLPNLVSNIHNIRCVGKGDTVYVGGKTFDIIWPQKNTRIAKTLYGSEIMELLGNTLGEADFQRYADLASKYRDTFMTIYNVYVQNGHAELVEYSQENEGQQAISHLVEQLQSQYEDIIFAAQTPGSNETISGRLDSFLSSIIHSMNDCSVVFECEDELVAFGDASNKLVDYLIDKNELSYKSYKVVKAPHHGTLSSWTHNIVNLTTQSILISNSGATNTKWAIAYEYGQFLSDKVLCTNNTGKRCKYYTAGNKCPKCNVPTPSIGVTV